MTDEPVPSSPTLAEAIAASLAARGIARIFGIPGGGSSLDVVDAAARHGIEFILCRTETAAAIMAAVTGELTGVPGVVLTGIGPGAASVVNGVAYASLERAPLVVVTDAHEDGAVAPPHQIFDQRALFAPITKAQARLDPATGADAFERLLDLAVAEPQGPVHVDLSAKDAGAGAAAVPATARLPAGTESDAQVDPEPRARAAALVAAARRPVVIAGLQIRDAAGTAAIRALASRLGAPAMTTYKAKGVFDDGDPRTVGLFTNAKLDAAVLARADMIVLAGVDPVEMIPGGWPHTAATIVLTRAAGLAYPFAPDAEIVGPPDAAAAVLTATARPSDWTAEEIRTLRAQVRDSVAISGIGHTADSVVDAVLAAAPRDARAAVDAGAHMFSAMTRWRAGAPHDVLKSNGLSTMGFAVPAAIAGWLAEPDRPAVALTGDGGMMMCLGELATAARLHAALTVIVLNDAALSLIDIKQQRQQRPPLGVRYPRVDYAAAARGMGCRAWSVGPEEALGPVLAEAFAADGPTLVDIAVDPSGYPAQLRALRG